MGKRSGKGTADGFSAELDRDVEQALRSPESLEVRELMQLIHRVNPTGDPMHPSKLRRRYEQKSKLQSLLVRQFPHDLSVTLDERSGVVAINHRFLAVDACHAPLASLDEDARAWVQLQLDTAAGAGRSDAQVRAERERPPDDSALGQGHAALEEYDFPAARGHFERAFAETQGGGAAALALLEVLVDTLAADVEALALEPRLAPGVERQGSIRGLLALAAARSGETERALTLADGGDAHAGQAVSVLVERAIATADLDALVALTGRIESIDRVHPDLGRLRTATTERRAAARRPLELKLEQALASGATADVATLAPQILASWPESAVARRALQHLEQVKRQVELAALRRRAAEARDRGDIDTAVALLHEAQRLGLPSPGLDDEVRGLEAQQHEARDTRAVEEVEQALGASLEDGLVAWASLRPLLRSRVVHAASVDHRAHWEVLPVEPARERVRALLAWDAAKVEASPSRALLRLGSHRQALSASPLARTLIEEWEHSVGAAAREEIQRQLNAAETAIGEGRYDDARAALANVPPADPRAQALAAELDSEFQRRAQREDCLRRVAGPDRLDARNAARELAGMTSGAEQLEWANRAATHEMGLRAELRLRVETLPADAPEAGLATRAEGFIDSELRSVHLSPSGQLLSARAYGRWLFITEIDLASQQVRRQVSLCAPEPWGGLAADGDLDGSCAWFAGKHGQVLALATADWEVRERMNLKTALPSAVQVNDLIPTPGGRYLWAIGSQLDQPLAQGASVVQVTSERVLRSYDRPLWYLIPDGDEAVLASVDLGHGAATIHGAGGGPSKRFPPLPTGWRHLRARVRPGHRDLVSLATRVPSSPGNDEPAPVSLVWPEPLPPIALSDVTGKNRIALASGSRQGIVAVLAERTDGAMLAVFSASGEERYRVELTRSWRVAESLTGEDVALCQPAPRGWVALALTQLPPPLPTPSLELVLPKLPLKVLTTCGALDLSVIPDLEQQQAYFASEKARLAKGGEQSVNADPLEIPRLLLAAALEIRDMDTARGLAQLAKVLGDWPTAFAIRFWRAQDAATRGADQEVSQHLENIDMAYAAPSERAHVHHLRGLLAFRSGDFAAAATAWRLGLEKPGGEACRLGELLPIAESLSAHPGAHPFGAALAKAERCRSKADAAGTRKALDCPAVHHFGELQTLARLAEAYLGENPVEPSARFRMHQLLARYVDSLHAEPEQIQNLPLPDRWSSEKLAAVEARAQAWLDAQ